MTAPRWRADSHVVLIGMMGAGKTTVGRLLAAQLGRRLVDSDLLIEARTGRTVRAIFADDGEEAFRDLESVALLDALSDAEPLVIAAAGGVVLREENRRALASSRVLIVWLAADPATLAERAVTGEHRPLLDDDPEAALRRLLPERAPLYRELADAVVLTTGRAPEAIAAEIAALLAGPAAAASDGAVP